SAAHRRDGLTEEGVRLCGDDSKQGHQTADQMPQHEHSHRSIPDKRSPDALWENVIQIKMDLSDDAHILAGRAGHRNDRLDPELDLLTGPDYSRIYRPDSLLAEAARHRR